MKAHLKNLRMSPRKVGLVAAMVRGMTVDEAVKTLNFTPRSAAKPMRKLISSAAANAVNNENRDRKNLVINEIVVTKGPTLRRGVSASRGRVAPISKRSSHIFVTLTDLSSVSA